MLLLLCCACSAELVASLVFPHGAIAAVPWPHAFLGSDNHTARAQSIALHEACRKTADATPQVDVWLVVTPHDLADSKSLLVFGGAVAAGNGDETEANYSYTMPQLSVSLDEELGVALCREVANCTLLSSPGDGVPLLWGSVVPLYFMQSRAAVPVVVLSVPSRRLDDNAVPMTDELVAVGKAVARVASTNAKRIGLVISGDLAHTHLAAGPYGWSPDAAPFDAAVAQWLTNGARFGEMGPLKDLAPKALSCAYAGLAVLAGVAIDTAIRLQSMFGPVAPGYYGMLVALFVA